MGTLSAPVKALSDQLKLNPLDIKPAPSQDLPVNPGEIKPEGNAPGGVTVQGLQALSVQPLQAPKSVLPSSLNTLNPLDVKGTGSSLPSVPGADTVKRPTDGGIKPQSIIVNPADTYTETPTDLSGAWSSDTAGQASTTGNYTYDDQYTSSTNTDYTGDMTASGTDADYYASANDTSMMGASNTEGTSTARQVRDDVYANVQSAYAQRGLTYTPDTDVSSSEANTAMGANTDVPASESDTTSQANLGVKYQYALYRSDKSYQPPSWVTDNLSKIGGDANEALRYYNQGEYGKDWGFGTATTPLGIYEDWRDEKGPAVQFYPPDSPLTGVVKNLSGVGVARQTAQKGSFGSTPRPFGPVAFTDATLDVLSNSPVNVQSGNSRYEQGMTEHVLGTYTVRTSNLGNSIGYTVFNKTGQTSYTRFPYPSGDGDPIEVTEGRDMDQEYYSHPFGPFNIGLYYGDAYRVYKQTGVWPRSVLADEPRSSSGCCGDMYEIFYWTEPKIGGGR
ncbi:hypothetical protein E5F05_01790 (plasmid) [Deinococcus metallilatus]|uniref:Uncharacterized protein n=1 Tax=Deinococcus metallilatus TaxID=1211322 RepID=A0ABR6MZX6_9DEIO|nr:hypothetical protein [Deinococcus metallilatus]MBB5296920.1 hypothetical protein [Deinococcus metallilatus]QBY06708.1 hypothetical protein E5F05_01790 [Deinococcus metallilatus]GMA15184.1 hypothetical protein GCM10025871_15150 [Deinococcus metallilatus]